MAELESKPTKPCRLELEGRHLEGGGQLLRIAVCLSALTKKPIRISNIRGNRFGGGGLKAQHLACVEWLAKASNATLSGASKGSMNLLFSPEDIEGVVSPVFTKSTLKDGRQIYETRVVIGTAGSTGLALQAILPFILFSDLPSRIPIHLHLSGGTNVSGSPSFEYTKYVILPTLHRIGFPQMIATLHKRGWSQGGSSIGKLTLEISPRKDRVLPAFIYRPEDISSYKPPFPSHLRAIFIAPTTCHDHFRTVLLPVIHQNFSEDFVLGSPNLTVSCEGSLHEKRFYFILIATIPPSSKTSEYVLARDWLFDRKIQSLDRTASEMALKVTADLATEWRSGAFVDEHMRDQLVIFQALAKGRSEVFPGKKMGGGNDGQLREASLHARTAEWVAKGVLGVKFDYEGVCEGIGFGDVEALEDDFGKLEI